MSKFDAAIKILEQRQLTLLTGLDVAHVSEMGELLSAIRVLEAANGFTADDIRRIGAALDNLPEYSPIAHYICPGKILKDKFRALLESLPEDSK